MKGLRERDFGEGESGVASIMLIEACAFCESKIVDERPARLGSKAYHAGCLVEMGLRQGRAERPMTQPNVWPNVLVQPGGTAGGTPQWWPTTTGTVTINGLPITVSDHTHSGSAFVVGENGSYRFFNVGNIGT